MSKGAPAILFFKNDMIKAEYIKPVDCQLWYYSPNKLYVYFNRDVYHGQMWSIDLDVIPSNIRHVLSYYQQPAEVPAKIDVVAIIDDWRAKVVTLLFAEEERYTKGLDNTTPVVQL